MIIEKRAMLIKLLETWEPKKYFTRVLKAMLLVRLLKEKP
jgi:hypothetical protein